MLNENTSKLRKDALRIFKAAISAVGAEKVIKQIVKLKRDKLKIGKKTYYLKNFKKIIVIGFGKASTYMAKALEEILGNRITDGLIITKYGYRTPLKRIKLIEAGHPLPDKNALLGSQKIKKLLSQTGKEDLVITLISGGGSALMTLPVKGINLQNLRKLTKLLLSSGATIKEINIIRKHLSQVKGGNLARLIYPTQSINLIISDVIGDNLDIIASGPTVPDPATFKEAIYILEKYKLTNKVSQNILKYLQKGVRGKLPETPKQGDPIFKKTYNLIVANNKLAILTAAQKARALGYKTKILSFTYQGEASKIARKQLKQIKKQSRPICLISGGETTVTIKGKGKGGRCQEFVLASAIEIAGKKNLVVLACGTDGTDGPTEAAGAIADGQTIVRAKKKRLDPEKYLINNDSHHFFKRLGDLIITGPTHTNVMDLYLILYKN